MSHVAHTGQTSRTSARSPTFWKPILFSIPAGVSTTRGVGFPRRGFSVSPFDTIAPSRLRSNTRENSIPFENVPDAVITGLRSTRLRLQPGARSTVRSIVTSSRGASRPRAAGHLPLSLTVAEAGPEPRDSLAFVASRACPSAAAEGPEELQPVRP